MNPFHPLTPLSRSPDAEQADRLSELLVNYARQTVETTQPSAGTSDGHGATRVPVFADPMTRARPIAGAKDAHGELDRIWQVLDGLVETQAGHLAELEVSEPGDPVEHARLDKARELQGELLMTLRQRAEQVRELRDTVDAEPTQEVAAEPSVEAPAVVPAEEGAEQEPSRVAAVWSSLNLGEPKQGERLRASAEPQAAPRKARQAGPRREADAPAREAGPRRGGRRIAR